MAALVDFLKQNISKEAAATTLLFGPGYIKQYNEAQNKLKGIVKIMADWAFWTLKVLQPLRAMFISGAVVMGFKAIGDAIQNVVRQTGSLESALRRLQSIQAAQRGLAPFVGGAGAAKQRVAELATMSGKGPFSFEEIADANKQLEVLTHGAYSSAKATQAIGEAAIATGNQIGHVADAVGEFYATLRSGQPIDGSAESLRQLGIISQQTANYLVSMQATGASTTEIFDRLSMEIDATAKSMSDMGDTVAQVNAEYQKAQENLKEKFGAPWAQSDVENTKNMIVVMTAIAPTVERISRSWALLFGSFATVRTELLKFVATTPAVRTGFEFIAKSVNGLLTGLLLVATVALPMLIPQINALLVSLTARVLGANAAVQIFTSGWGTLIRSITAVGAIGLAVTGAVMLGGAIANLVKSNQAFYKELNRQGDAFAKSNRAIKEQISNAKTLQEQQDAVTAAMNQATDAYSSLMDVQGKLNDVTKDFFTNILDPLAIPKLILQMQQLDAAEAASIDVMKKAEATFNDALRHRGAMTGPALSAFAEQRRRAGFITEQREFERAQQLRPGERPEILTARAATLRQRAGLGEGSAAARAGVEQATAETAQQKAAAQFNLAKMEKTLQLAKQTKAPQQDIANLEAAMAREKENIANADQKMLLTQKSAKQGTAVQLEAQIRQNELAIEAGSALAAGDKERSKELFIQSGGAIAVTEEQREQLRNQNLLLKVAHDTAKEYEDGANTLRDQADAMDDNVKALEREQKLVRFNADTELKRRIAQREGRSDEAIALRNQEEFAKRFEELRQTLPEQEARQRALAETAESIQERVPPGGPNAVASSMARLGLGGGVYAPGGDPTLETQKQIAGLIQLSNQYLSAIAAKGDGVQ